MVADGSWMFLVFIRVVQVKNSLRGAGGDVALDHFGDLVMQKMRY